MVKYNKENFVKDVNDTLEVMSVVEVTDYYTRKIYENHGVESVESVANDIENRIDLERQHVIVTKKTRSGHMDFTITGDLDAPADFDHAEIITGRNGILGEFVRAEFLDNQGNAISISYLKSI